MSARAKSAREQATLRMTNVAHARQEFGRFCAEVTFRPPEHRASKKPLLAGWSRDGPPCGFLS